jgi:hypothetical protein
MLKLMSLFFFKKKTTTIELDIPLALKYLIKLASNQSDAWDLVCQILYTQIICEIYFFHI